MLTKNAYMHILRRNQFQLSCNLNMFEHFGTFQSEHIDSCVGTQTPAELGVVMIDGLVGLHVISVRIMLPGVVRLVLVNVDNGVESPVYMHV